MMAHLINNEKWVSLHGYEGYYEINNYGTVRSLDRKVRYKDNGIAIKKGRIMKPKVDKYGYLHLCLCDAMSGRKFKTVHRMVALSFNIPNPENKATVNHKDGNKLNNSVSNLEWMSAGENSTHAAKMGLYRGRKGTDNTLSKLTEHQVHEIRYRYKMGVSLQKDLALEYGVCKQVVNCIILRKTWKHV